MKQITCTGSPYSIGFAHGSQARDQVRSTISFYTALLTKNTKLSWPELIDLGSSFETSIKRLPDIYSELHGVADGAGVSFGEILTINVRTELNFGHYSDGCTALSWLSNSDVSDTGGSTSILAQNWDWSPAQRPNLIILDIQPSTPTRPRIKMVTEAGLVGKIGFNDAGVGVCLNAIKAPGMDRDKVPCHIALRVVLDSASRDDARTRLHPLGGVASACHMLVADTQGGTGLEWTCEMGRLLEMDGQGRVVHTNHFLHPDLRGKDVDWLRDSAFRVDRIGQLCDKLGRPSLENVQGLFADEQNYPAAICRREEGECEAETLFNITMDLTRRKARVLYGRPVQPLERIDLAFS